MAIGIRVRNTSGTMQVDDQYENYYIVGSGSAVTTTYDPSSTTNPDGITEILFDLPSPSMLAVPLTSYPITPQNTIAASGANYKHGFLVKAAAGVTINYLILGPPPVITDTIGLRVRRASDGKIMFQSGGKPVRVASLWIEQNPDVNANKSVKLSWTKTMTSGRTYAALFNQPLFLAHTYFGGIMVRRAAFVSISSNIAKLEELTWKQGSTSVPNNKLFGSALASLLLIDTTNY